MLLSIKITLSSYIKMTSIAVLSIYSFGFFIAQSIYVIKDRYTCIEEDGFIGFFWCSEPAIFNIFLVYFVKALAWPYHLYLVVMST